MNFDKVAPIYYPLANLVFGKVLADSQRAHIRYISPGDRILIIGGGKGNIIKEILQVSPNHSIYFVEPSEKMLCKAKKKLKMYEKQIEFINLPIEEVSPIYVDIICTFYFLDLFTDTALESIILHIKKFSQPGTTWLNTDFIPSIHQRLWQKCLSYSQLIFFKLLANVKASHIPETDKYFQSDNWKLLASSYFKKGYISSTAWQREF